MTKSPPTDTCRWCKLQIWGGRFDVVRSDTEGHFCSNECLVKFNWAKHEARIKGKARFPEK